MRFRAMQPLRPKMESGHVPAGGADEPRCFEIAPRLSNLARGRGVESALRLHPNPHVHTRQQRSASLAPEKVVRRICRISATQHQTQNSGADHKLATPLPLVMPLRLVLLVSWLTPAGKHSSGTKASSRRVGSSRLEMNGIAEQTGVIMERKANQGKRSGKVVIRRRPTPCAAGSGVARCPTRCQTQPHCWHPRTDRRTDRRRLRRPRPS